MLKFRQKVYLTSGISPKFREPEVGDFGATRCGFSQKSPNLDCIFGVFEQFLAKLHQVSSLMMENKNNKSFINSLFNGCSEPGEFGHGDDPMIIIALLLLYSKSETE